MKSGELQYNTATARITPEDARTLTGRAPGGDRPDAPRRW